MRHKNVFLTIIMFFSHLTQMEIKCDGLKVNQFSTGEQGGEKNKVFSE